jgi:hypothetical protein
LSRGPSGIRHSLLKFFHVKQVLVTAVTSNVTLDYHVAFAAPKFILKGIRVDFDSALRGLILLVELILVEAGSIWQASTTLHIHFASRFESLNQLASRSEDIV